MALKEIKYKYKRNKKNDFEEISTYLNLEQKKVTNKDIEKIPNKNIKRILIYPDNEKTIIYFKEEFK